MTQRTTRGQMIHPRRGDEVALYKLYDAAGELIYVGIANNPHERWASHASRWSWWSEVDAFEVEWLDSRERAEDAEREYLQRDEPPRYNFRGTNRLSPRATASIQRTVRLSRETTDARFREQTGRNMRDFAAAYTQEVSTGQRGAIKRTGERFGLSVQEASRRVRMCRAWGLLPS